VTFPHAPSEIPSKFHPDYFINTTTAGIRYELIKEFWWEFEGNIKGV